MAFLLYFRNLADVSNDNVLSVEEFVLAMHLILRIKDGLPLPKSLPKHLVPKVVPAAELADLTKQEKEAYQNVFNKITQEEIDGKNDSAIYEAAVSPVIIPILKKYIHQRPILVPSEA